MELPYAALNRRSSVSKQQNASRNSHLLNNLALQFLHQLLCNSVINSQQIRSLLFFDNTGAECRIHLVQLHLHVLYIHKHD